MIKLLAAVNKCLEILVVGMLTGMTILVFLNVVLRYGFNSGITVTEELSRIFFVWITFLGAVLALGGDEHVTVNFLVLKLPAKIRAYWSLVTDCALTACAALLLYGSIQLAMQNISNHMPITGIPTGINFVAAAIMAGLFCLLLAVRLAVKVQAIRRGTIQ